MGDGGKRIDKKGLDSGRGRDGGHEAGQDEAREVGRVGLRRGGRED